MNEWKPNNKCFGGLCSHGHGHRGSNWFGWGGSFSPGSASQPHRDGVIQFNGKWFQNLALMMIWLVSVLQMRNTRSAALRNPFTGVREALSRFSESLSHVTESWMERYPWVISPSVGPCGSVETRDVKRNPVLHLRLAKIEFIFSLSSRKLHKNYRISGKINSSICLMLSVYKSFHQTVKYWKQRNDILHDLTGLEIQISMKTSKTENLLETGFQRP